MLKKILGYVFVALPFVLVGSVLILEAGLFNFVLYAALSLLILFLFVVGVIWLLEYWVEKEAREAQRGNPE